MGLARLIRKHATDENIGRQLKRLPLFLLPGDTEDKFQHLLDRLDEVVAGNS